MSLTDDLIREFREQAGLKEHDAAIAAFIVMAFNCGWPNAQIGRYTGVSRARIGQKLEKYRKYAYNGMPEVARMLTTARTTITRQNVAVAFSQPDWKVEGFRVGMLTYINKEVSGND